MITNHLFGVPVKDNNQVVPTPGADLDLGHIRTPDLVGTGSPWLGTENGSFGSISAFFTD